MTRQTRQKMLQKRDVRKAISISNIRTTNQQSNVTQRVRVFLWYSLSFFVGLVAHCDDRSLNATLLCNRSASHFYLGNYRSCLRDCTMALKLDSNYTKVSLRGAQALIKLGKASKAIQWINATINNVCCSSLIVILFIRS
jgi:hypothetical protein